MANPQEVSLTEFLQLHQKGVWRYLRYLGCDADQANDLTQEVFVSLLRGKMDLLQMPKENARAYLYTSAKNAFRMELRRNKKLRSLVSLAEAENVAGLDLAFEDDNHLGALRECLSQLDGRAKEVLELRYRKNASRDEMAKSLDMGEDGVKSLLRRVRDVLKSCMERKLRHED